MEDLRKPILPGKGASDYERYLRTDELLSLQKSPEEFLHPDEMTFQVVHQASELLMKGAVWELERGRKHIDRRGRFPQRRRAPAPRQSHAGVSHLHAARAGDHHALRLSPDSRRPRPRQRPRLSRAFSPCCTSARAWAMPLTHQLSKPGLTVDELYRRHEEFFGLHDVAERLLDFDERMHLFRFHHLKLAERIIGGGVVGTMGTPVEVLHQRMEHLFYKELWDVRNLITAKINAQVNAGAGRPRVRRKRTTRLTAVAGRGLLAR